MNQFNKQEKSWIMYDWANSVYATIIMAAVFPIYFSYVMSGVNLSGDVYWGYGTSISTLIVSILAPILGALADFRGMKKKLFVLFLVIGVIFTLTMAITDNWLFMLVGYIISYIGFSGANLFYDSFLTDVTEPGKMDKLSAYGFAFGYIGGSTIPFVISIALVTWGDNFGIGDSLAVKISVVMTSVWWAVFSIPILLNVRQTNHLEKPKNGIIIDAFKNIVFTAKEIAKNKGMLIFILAYFFYIDGVGTVIHMATAYGASLGLGSTGMILALLVTQIVAAPFSILFSRIAAKIGAFKVLVGAIVIYIFICLLGFYMGFSLENAERAAIALFGGDYKTSAIYTDALSLSQILFWILAAMVGTCQGGLQALSRSCFAKMITSERSNEFFGFFDIFGRFATIIGPALYAVFADVTGRSSIGILSLIVIFIIGAALLIIGKKHIRFE